MTTGTDVGGIEKKGKVWFFPVSVFVDLDLDLDFVVGVANQ